MGSEATVNIPKDVIEPIVKAQVAAGIVAALGNPEQIIIKAVEHAMRQKVDSSGKVSDSSYNNNHDLIEVLSRKLIHQVVRESLEKWVEEQRPAIEEQVKKSLKRKESTFAKALVDGVVSATKQDWRFNCNVTMNGG